MNNGYDPHLNHEGDYKHKEKNQLVSNDVQALQGDKKLTHPHFYMIIKCEHWEIH